MNRAKCTTDGRKIRLDGIELATAVNADVAEMVARAVRAYDGTRRVAGMVARAIRELADALEAAAEGGE